MYKTTLVIMAAGIGSRFGGGIKQLLPIGPSGEIIMDYSIHDALEAGFDKIIFIIRRDLEEDFKQIIGKRIEKICKVEYVYQELSAVPAGYCVPNGRLKPWGTGQAVLSVKGYVHEPFLVINADDYYGKEAFRQIHNFLIEHYTDKNQYCMAGFVLKNTLSENGGVTRGVCEVDQYHTLLRVLETPNIVKTAHGAGVLGEDGITKIEDDSYVSMNMWGVTPEFLEVVEQGFIEFLAGLTDNACKAEYLLPLIFDQLIKSKSASVKVLETKDKWFGVTYKEDRALVVASINALIQEGLYPKKLFD